MATESGASRNTQLKEEQGALEIDVGYLLTFSLLGFESDSPLI